MLRVELFTVVPVIPTCSMYLRQLWRFAARNAGARYIQIKYFQRSNVATAHRRKVQTTTARASSIQMRRRMRLLRTGEGLHRKACKKTVGVKNMPKFNSRK